MLQKAIENWLINTNERRYQLPFVQVLIAEGHTIKYVSKHTQLEQGKDIISIDSSGVVWAFQLKTGNVNLSEWKNIVGEIRELSELSPVHSSIPAGTPFRAVLVTNGRIGDLVRQQIVQINQDNIAKNRQVAKIETVEVDELIGRFLKGQGDFIPTQPIDVSKFLSFYLATGQDFFDKKLFQEFILGSCLLETAKHGTEAKHAVTSAVIMTAYSLKNYQEKKNHLAIFEAWISLLGYICRFATQKGMDKELMESIGEMLLDEAVNEIQQLEEEMFARPINQAFVVENMFGDGALIYRARATIVLGVICAYHEYLHEHGMKDITREKTFEYIFRNLQTLWLWGESAFPYFYWIIRFLETSGKTEKAGGMWMDIFAVLSSISENENLWFPSPYVSAEEVIRKNYGMIRPEEEREVEPKSPGSYILKTIIEIIARRSGRMLLEQRWRQVSHVYLLEFIPREVPDMFLWRSESGTNDAKPPEKTQRWKTLLETSLDKSKVPIFKFDCANTILPFYILVAPHRATTNIIRKFELR